MNFKNIILNSCCIVPDKVVPRSNRTKVSQIFPQINSTLLFYFIDRDNFITVHININTQKKTISLFIYAKQCGLNVKNMSRN